MVEKSLVLVSDPGSASRKYAIYNDDKQLVKINFEPFGKKVHCTLTIKNEKHVFEVKVKSLDSVLGLLLPLLEKYKVIKNKSEIDRIGIRIAAPSSYFLINRVIDNDVVEHLKTINDRAPIQIKSLLNEIKLLKLAFPRVKIIAVSDSAFHARKPDHAWNYGINLRDADRFDIKRFGYHGLASESIVNKLKDEYKLPDKLIVCNIGNSTSVNAILKGKSIDSTTGFTQLEGPIMSTKSGSIGSAAVISLKAHLGLKDKTINEYLNNQSGLLGLSGISGDIRELLAVEHENHNSKLAIQTYIFSIQKSIGHMAAALNGCDALVYTGLVGTNSPTIRKRITENLEYLRFSIDPKINKAKISERNDILTIHIAKHSKPIYIMHSDESGQIAKHTNNI